MIRKLIGIRKENHRHTWKTEKENHTKATRISTEFIGIHRKSIGVLRKTIGIPRRIIGIPRKSIGILKKPSEYLGNQRKT